jgi:hypothetical protein
MIQKNTSTTKKTYNTRSKMLYKKRKKLLDNSIEPVFHDEEDDLYNEEFSDGYSGDENDEVIEKDDEDEEVDDEIEDTIKEIVEEKIVEEKPKKRGRKASDKAKHYVDPKEFDEEIMVYYESADMSDNLAMMISKISNKLSYAPNFINYSYREEMVGDGIIRMMKALIAKKYNREKGTNPFSYFTRIAFNAFRNRIKKEKHIHETHEKYQREFMLMSESFNHLSKNNNINIMKERDRER